MPRGRSPQPGEAGENDTPAVFPCALSRVHPAVIPLTETQGLTPCCGSSTAHLCVYPAVNPLTDIQRLTRCMLVSLPSGESANGDQAVCVCVCA